MSDWTYLTNEHDTMRIQWSDFNGHFQGQRINGTSFSHESEELEGEDWYAELLDIFYLPKEAAA